MSFYRMLLTVFAAFVLTLPAFADEAPTSSDSAAQAPAAQQAKVDINKATVKELIKVKGITPGKAKAIISYRKKNGDFKSVDELKNVKGFKKMNTDQMKQIEDQLTAG